MVEENVSNRQEKLYKLSLQQQNKEKGMKETINQLQEWVNNLKEEYTERMFCGKKCVSNFGGNVSGVKYVILSIYFLGTIELSHKRSPLIKYLFYEKNKITYVKHVDF